MKVRLTPSRWHLSIALLVLVAFAGCSATRPAGYRTFFLPPAAQVVESADLDPAPVRMEATYYAHEMPAVLDDPARRLAPPSTTDPLSRRAEARFQEGRRLFRAGLMEQARREFDRAIDILLSGPEPGPGRHGLERKLSELAEAIHQYDISGLGANEPGAEPAFDQSPLEEIPELTFPIDPKLRDQVSEQLKATVSQLPLVVNDDVLRYINYFSSGRGRKTLLNGLKRAGRFRTMIRRIFDEEGVPQELIHLAQAESGFSPRAVSRKRATGMWQFMLWRGQEYGLMRTKAADDRLDPEKATRAAARHLRDLYHEFGDWYLAMAAYNCGPLCVERAVERTGYADVWELRRRSVLPKETSNYVPIILAMAIIVKSPAQWGIEAVEVEAPLEYSTVELDAPTHLALIADIADRSPAEIRELNPALLTNVAPARFAVHVPAGSGPAVLSALELIPAARRTSWRLYRVTEGDTLTSIARLHKTTSKQVAAANASAGEVPEAGSLLIVPAPEQRRQTASAASKPPGTAKAPAKKRTIAKAPAKKQTVAKAPAKKRTIAKAPAKKQIIAKAPAKKQTVAKAPAKKPAVAKTVTAPIGTALAATRPSAKQSSGVAR
jgi:membrane-bound lytic murein transglycosylase D